MPDSVDFFNVYIWTVADIQIFSNSRQHRVDCKTKMAAVSAHDLTSNSKPPARMQRSSSLSSVLGVLSPNKHHNAETVATDSGKAVSKSKPARSNSVSSLSLTNTTVAARTRAAAPSKAQQPQTPVFVSSSTLVLKQFAAKTDLEFGVVSSGHKVKTSCVVLALIFAHTAGLHADDREPERNKHCRRADTRAC